MSLVSDFKHQVEVTNRYYPLMLVLFAPVLIWFGANLYLEMLDLEKSGEAVEVRVVSLDEDRSDGTKMYRAVLEVDLADGKRKRFRGSTWSSAPIHDVGYVGPGYYSPTTGRIASAEMIESDRSSGMIMTAVGGAMFILGLIWMYRRHRRGTVKVSDY